VEEISGRRAVAQFEDALVAAMPVVSAL
jgi:hypothetical protein